jgi:hypothetical protein
MEKKKDKKHGGMRQLQSADMLGENKRGKI